jgi:DNA-binding winged helix-turn-helix (wHTH) protein
MLRRARQSNRSQALRRALRDGQDRNHFIVNVPGRWLLFRRLGRYIGSRELSATGEAGSRVRHYRARQ